jgi:hypothetical protein
MPVRVGAVSLSMALGSRTGVPRFRPACLYQERMSGLKSSGKSGILIERLFNIG